MSTYYIAGALYLAGTNMPANVTGDCPHRHRTPDAAARCIAATTRAVQRGHGPNAWVDRVVIKVVDGHRSIHFP